mmetsp:Transcript_5930/g.8448  ORF Transcript_5930/g.8448 Transcript_5930/m.8448 type:complete len:120 (-) Transcript_5930:160-519(-)
MVLGHARWARCRGASVSMWARQMNEAAFGSVSGASGRRTMAAAAAVSSIRCCAELRPATSFAEQAGSGAGETLTGLLKCEDDVTASAGLVDSDESALEELLDEIVNCPTSTVRFAKWHS